LLLGRALAKLPAKRPIYALPSVCYGKSNEHIGFPCTLSVSAATFMAVLRDLGSSIASAGFKKRPLYYVYGGNLSLGRRDGARSSRRIRAANLCATRHVRRAFKGLNPRENAYGFHAGEVETAFLLVSVPELVDRSAYTVNYIPDVNRPELLRQGKCLCRFFLAYPRHRRKRRHGRSAPGIGGEWNGTL
jgi:creatinine amidohydrolase